jgi:YggT family protein
MIELLSFIRMIVNAYYWIIIASAILSWLIGFGLVNYSNPMVRQLWTGLNAVTEPLLKPIRRMLPNTGGLDFSPLVLIFACIGISDFLIPFLARTLG